MPISTKKFICLLLAAVMLNNSMGYFIVFKSRQFAVKQEIKKRILNNPDDRELDVIAVADFDTKTQKEIRWYEKNEFRYKGCMYDIVRVRRHLDTTFYYCINDLKEERLLAELEQFIQKHKEENSNDSKKTNSLIKTIVREAVLETQSLKIFINFLRKLFVKNIFTAPNCFLEIPTPPPRN